MRFLRYLALPFFVLRLGVVILPSVWSLVTVGVHWFPLLPSLVIFIVQIWWAGKTWHALSTLPLLPAVSELPDTAPVLPLPTEPEIINADRPTLETHRAALLKIYEKQPTHREVLLNLGLLEWSLGNPQTATAYWQEAQQTDPLIQIVETSQ